MEIDAHGISFFPEDKSDGPINMAYTALCDRLTSAFPESDLFISVFMRADYHGQIDGLGLLARPDVALVYAGGASETVVIHSPNPADPDDPEAAELGSPSNSLFELYTGVLDAPSNHQHVIARLHDSVRAWARGESVRYYLAPYIVRTIDESEIRVLRNRRDSCFLRVHDARGEREGEYDRLVYTKPIEITARKQQPGDWPTQRGRDGAPPPHYTSGVFVGVRSQPAVDMPAFLDCLEAFSIQFQLSWSYPELIGKRAKQVRKESDWRVRHEVAQREMERQQEDLVRREGTARVAAEVITIVEQLSLMTRQLRFMNNPTPEGAFDSYRRADAMIPSATAADTVLFFKRWGFRHAWEVEEAASPRDAESFRAQLSCILLAIYASEPLTPFLMDWPENTLEPWELLTRLPKRIDTACPEIASTAVKLVGVGPLSAWDEEDMDAFGFLKMAVHDSFKDSNNQPLTGALLLLWARTEGHDVDPRAADTLYRWRDKTKGVGNCPVSLLSAVHYLVVEEREIHRNGNLAVYITADPSNDRSVGVTITCRECRPDFIKALTRFQDFESQYSHRATGDQTNDVASLGTTHYQVREILRYCGPIQIDAERSEVVIRLRAGRAGTR